MHGQPNRTSKGWSVSIKRIEFRLREAISQFSRFHKPI